MNPTTPQNPKDGWYWPWLLIGLLVVSSAGSILMVIIAVNDPSFAVEDNYYKKAVEWDKQIAKAKLEQALGWKAQVKVSPHPKNARLKLFQVALKDSQGFALDKAQIKVRAFHNAQASQKIKLQLHALGKGNYQAPILIHRPGLWVFQVFAVQGKHHFSIQSRQMLKTPSMKVPTKG
ncbi:MAG: FixH family protein [Myxococcales bacterium]|nr:FixH family protein [Myxococcales bacterium]